MGNVISHPNIEEQTIMTWKMLKTLSRHVRKCIMCITRPRRTTNPACRHWQRQININQDFRRKCARVWCAIKCVCMFMSTIMNDYMRMLFSVNCKNQEQNWTQKHKKAGNKFSFCEKAISTWSLSSSVLLVYCSNCNFLLDNHFQLLSEAIVVFLVHNIVIDFALQFQ